MLHVRVSFDGCEIERRDLTDTIVIGRWAGCDLAVRDILLSRRHCKLEPDGDGAQVVDLESKNGTFLNDILLCGIERLSAGDALKLGRVRISVGAGTLGEAGLTPLRMAPRRPADPSESMTGTFAGFGYLEPGAAAAAESFAGRRPQPRPEPRLPAAYEREDIHSLLTAIASSSWDSIYAQARRPAPAYEPLKSDVAPMPRKMRPRTPLDAVPRPIVMRRQARRSPRAVSMVWIVLIGLLAMKGWSDARILQPPAARAAAAPVVQPVNWTAAMAPPVFQIATAAVMNLGWSYLPAVNSERICWWTSTPSIRP